MKAGILRDRLELQEHDEGGLDDWGTPLPNAWITVARIWGSVRHLSGTETIKAGADTSIVRASIRVRRRAAVTAGCRILFNGKTYDIEAVLPDSRRIYSDLICKLVE
ncbi:hypothetical protein SDC9_146203 [bioreactor metagenome]|uniref:Phage head-tail joining protein n=1 Tax=bioreactor metagenome TaxID=1076179 RepID=A0A645EE21_9ZZZZ